LRWMPCTWLPGKHSLFCDPLCTTLHNSFWNESIHEKKQEKDKTKKPFGNFTSYLYEIYIISQSYTYVIFSWKEWNRLLTICFVK
jgi:hypothetical protein